MKVTQRQKNLLYHTFRFLRASLFTTFWNNTVFPIDLTIWSLERIMSGPTLLFPRGLAQIDILFIAIRINDSPGGFLCPFFRLIVCLFYLLVEVTKCGLICLVGNSEMPTSRNVLGLTRQCHDNRFPLPSL